MKKVIGLLPFIILAASTYLSFSNSRIAPSINQWQATMMGDNKYFPALVTFIPAMPPLLVLLVLKLCW